MERLWCPYCKTEFSPEKDKRCPGCDQPVNDLFLQRARHALLLKGGVILAVVAVLVVGFILWAVIDGSNNEPKAAVYNSAGDGSVQQVRDYLRDNLRDPKSVDYIEWSKVAEVPDGYMVRVKYRAKNAFGGYVIDHKVFSFDSQGMVTGVMDFE